MFTLPWFRWPFCSPKSPPPVVRRVVYRILRGGDLPTLESEVHKFRHDIVKLVGGVSSCAWNQPGEGPQHFFTQAVLVWEDIPTDETPAP